MTIKGVLIDVMSNTAKVVEIEKSLKSYYKILNCDLIDITSRYIGGKLFDIICDDEGLFKEDFIASAVTSYNRIALVGNLFVVKFDGKDDETSLDDEDIEHILNHVKQVKCNLYEEERVMLVKVDHINIQGDQDNHRNTSCSNEVHQ